MSDQPKKPCFWLHPHWAKRLCKALEIRGMEQPVMILVDERMPLNRFHCTNQEALSLAAQLGFIEADTVIETGFKKH